MKRRYLLIALLSAAYAAAQTAPAPAKEESLPSAETILDRYIEVTGGKPAYEKRKNEVQTGTIEFKAMGLKGTVSRYAAIPAQDYTLIDIEGVGKIEAGLNDGVAWEKSAMMGARIKTGEEKAQAIREGTFNASLYWRKLYQKAETTGTNTIDGEPCYTVVVTPNEGRPETMYYQKKSGLVVKITGVAVNQMGEAPFEVLVTDYKTFEGLKIPSKITQRAAQQEFIITIDDVKINQPLPADRFDMPAEVKALLQKPTAKE